MFRPNLAQIEAILGTGRVKQHKDLSAYLTLRNAVQAEFYFEAENAEDFHKVYEAAQKYQLPIFFLGGGSNLAITKKIIPGLVVRNMYQKLEVIAENDDHVLLSVSSGYSVGRLVKETTEKGFEGFEYHLGLPGTVGGAIYMNSKWTKPVQYFGDRVDYAFLLDSTGKEKKVHRDYFEFAYDYSILHKTKELLLSVVFKLKRTNPEVLKQRAKEALEYRHQTQPPSVGTAGCFFQNISDEEQQKLGLKTKSAGYLIDKAGLKGAQVGNFIVSDKHANFVINKAANSGVGNPEDLQTLLTKIKTTVKEKFGVELKEEVVII